MTTRRTKPLWKRPALRRDPKRHALALARLTALQKVGKKYFGRVLAPPPAMRTDSFAR